MLPLLALAQYPDKPGNYVTDETGTLTESQRETLNRKLHSFEDSTSNQVFVYMVPSLNGREISDLCQEIFHNWHIGKKGKNNGVLIAIFKNDHKFRIHTGYGLEGALPDQLTKRIQDEDMRPYFKQNDYFTGIDKGTDKLIYYSAHEYTVNDEVPNDDWIGWALGYGPNLILLCVLLYLLIGKKKQKSKPVLWYFLLIGGIVFSLIPCLGAVITFFMVGAATGWKSKGGRSYSSGGSYSSYDSSSSGSDYSSSSDSGSGFDGGGGGDSGGGGSSSDW